MANKDKPSQEVKGYAVSGDGMCEECGVPAVFALKYGEEHIPLDLITVLRCLKMASDHGLIPPVPDIWWHQTTNHFNADI